MAGGFSRRHQPGESSPLAGCPDGGVQPAVTSKPHSREPKPTCGARDTSATGKRRYPDEFCPGYGCNALVETARSAPLKMAITNGQHFARPQRGERAFNCATRPVAESDHAPGRLTARGKAGECLRFRSCSLGTTRA